MQAIRYEKDQDNIVTLTIDTPGQSVNTMNEDFRMALTEATDRLLQEKTNIIGIVITSAKKTFFAGGDLDELVKVTSDDAQAFFQTIEGMKAKMRDLETLDKPIVVAINGTALGGGWEICLACHHRICLNDNKIKLGLPEVTLGLLPGGGGVVRTIRLLGFEKSMPLLLEGKQIGPKQAQGLGLVHELVDEMDQLIPQAKNWIKGNPVSRQPWDEKGFKLPGGSPNHPKIAQMLSIAPAMLRKKTHGCYPAPEAILSAAVEGAHVDFNTASTIESRYFVQLVTSQIAKNMIGTLWFQLNEVKAGSSRPQGIEPNTVNKIGVLGAGMMGAGIAYSSAIRGIDIVLKDVSQAQAEKGKGYSEKLLQKKVSRAHLSREKKESILQQILPTNNNQDLVGCDLIIEAVFEDQELKNAVIKDTESMINNSGFYASNTSTLPITGLANVTNNPEKFIGLHFFSPVDKMQLVEIIKGEQTSAETLAKGFDFVLQINKIPIVVNDSRGFFTSRVFGTYVNEGIAMLAEGQNPSSIEQAALQAGMPVGPLKVTDEVSLTLMNRIRTQTKLGVESQGKEYTPHPAEVVADEMVDQYQREGKAKGAGFYDYPANGKSHIWPKLFELYVQPDEQISLIDMQERLLFIQAIETVRCLEEGVLESVRDANIGSIFGLGFAPWSGGVLQYINQYGVLAFTQRAEQLADLYGHRFIPPALLVDKAKSKGQFVDC